ncbi:potassium channel family protein [Streptomyces racemochromogenes]|uniref:Potassium channel family protein n=1 Tax=Streptomyces racemochromogenes TaxID=67353 RepID=A0ABW7PCD9_9ACTN
MDATDPTPDGTPPAAAAAPRQERRERRGRAALVVALRCLATITVLVSAYFLLPFTRRDVDVRDLVVGLSAVTAVFALQIRSIARSAHPRLRAIEALTTTMPLFLLMYAATYFVIEETTPGSFSESLTRTDALYFTLTVFSTVGFGDIVARTEPARVLVMTQMVVNVLAVGVATRILFGAVEAAVRRQTSGTRDPG